MGAERLVMSVDYPFVGNEGFRSFLAGAALDPQAARGFAHANAEALFGLR